MIPLSSMDILYISSKETSNSLSFKKNGTLRMECNYNCYENDNLNDMSDIIFPFKQEAKYHRNCIKIPRLSRRPDKYILPFSRSMDKNHPFSRSDFIDEYR